MKCIGGCTCVASMLVLAALILAPVAGAHGQEGQEQAPTKIKRCERIDQPGSYKLVNNLHATGDCLVIATEGVTIDLAGFALTGDGTGTAIKGVQTSAGTIPPLRTVVRNGDISNFAQAIKLSGIAEGLRITSNHNGISVAVGIVRGNIVQSNDSVGIDLADGLVTDNVVIANQTGISVREAAVITGNSVQGNKIGVDVTGTGSTVIGNIIDGNSRIGLRIRCPSNITDNTAVGNGTNLVLSDAGCRNEGNVAP
jgi:hypothetical protein